MCAVPSPFRGHLRTQSNAFSLGHGSRLSSQYLIRHHMLMHYDKILSAKAAIDCSIPKSMKKSIKYRDQQRRERMKQEVARLDRESPHSVVSSRPHSRDSVASILHRTDTCDPPSPRLRHSPYSDPGPMYSPSSFSSSLRPPRCPGHTAELHGGPAASRAHGGLSAAATTWSTSCKFQDNQSRTYGGDLLEKHSHHFTNKERPFTPRTLKTQAKSALAQSRYYTPPRRKRRGTAAEAETQTDMSSFQHILRTPERSSSPIGDQERNNENLHLSDEDDERQQRCSSREEELAYLTFVAEVTNEILSLGLFSDRVLNRVFQRHLEENRDRLDQDKMRHLLDILRADLDYKEESSLKSFVTSPWDKDINGRCQEAASAYLEGLRMGQDQPEDTLEYMDGAEAKDPLRDGALIVTAIGPQDDAQTKQEDGGDLLPRRSHDQVLGFPEVEDLQVLEKTSEDYLLLDISIEDQTPDPGSSSADSPNARRSSMSAAESLDDLPQSFSDLVHISTASDILDPEEEEAETKDHNDF